MSKHLDIEKEFFLRSARGNEYDAYAALVAEVDAMHHAEIPALIKTPERTKPEEQDFLTCLQDPDRLLDFAVEDTEGERHHDPAKGVQLVRAAMLVEHEHEGLFVR